MKPGHISPADPACLTRQAGNRIVGLFRGRTEDDIDTTANQARLGDAHTARSLLQFSVLLFG